MVMMPSKTSLAFLNYFIDVFCKICNFVFFNLFLLTIDFLKLQVYVNRKKSRIKSFEILRHEHLVLRAIANSALLIATLLANSSRLCSITF